MPLIKFETPSFIYSYTREVDNVEDTVLIDLRSATICTISIYKYRGELHYTVYLATDNGPIGIDCELDGDRAKQIAQQWINVKER